MAWGDETKSAATKKEEATAGIGEKATAVALVAAAKMGVAVSITTVGVTEAVVQVMHG